MKFEKVQNFIVLFCFPRFFPVSNGELQKLLVISFGGLRYDYVYHENFNTLRMMMRWAFIPRVEPVFPSKMIPNHVSMATGLFTESHGVLGPFIDSSGSLIDLNDTSYWSYRSNILPIWSLNEKASGDGRGERLSGCMMWPGCGHIHPPTYHVPYNFVAWPDRLDTVLDWLTRPRRAANLALLYVEEPRLSARQYGADSAQVYAQLAKLDRLLARLLRQLRQLQLLNRLNVVLTSDQGALDVRVPERLISLDSVLAPRLYTPLAATGGAPLLGIVANDGGQGEGNSSTEADRLLYIYDKLRDGCDRLSLPYSVYVRRSVPARWHYAPNGRVPPIVAMANAGFVFDTGEIRQMAQLRRDANTSGTTIVFASDGYDPALPAMHHPLIARGPAFRHTSPAPSAPVLSPTPPPSLSSATTATQPTAALNNVDIFLLCARVLQLTHLPPHNASWWRVQQLLVAPFNLEGAAVPSVGGKYASAESETNSDRVRFQFRLQLWLTVGALTLAGFSLFFITCLCVRYYRSGAVHYSRFNKNSQPSHHVTSPSCAGDVSGDIFLHAIDSDDEVHYMMPLIDNSGAA